MPTYFCAHRVLWIITYDNDFVGWELAYFLNLEAMGPELQNSCVFLMLWILESTAQEKLIIE